MKLCALRIIANKHCSIKVELLHIYKALISLQKLYDHARSVFPAFLPVRYPDVTVWKWDLPA